MAESVKNEHTKNDELNVAGKWQHWRKDHAWVGTLLSILFLLLLIIAGAVLVAIVLWAIHPNDAPSWTGFGNAQLPLYSGISPYKNLWDWLGLLIIPIVLAIGAALIGRAQQNREFQAREFESRQAEETRQNEWAIEKDRQEQTIITEYYSRMGQLMLEYDLRSSSADDDIRYIARAISVGVFRGINATRKGQVLQFLYEADLINTPDPIVNLRGADLSQAELQSAELPKAHLAGIDLHEAKMNHANLAGSDFSNANMIHIELRRSNLKEAKLSEAYLSGAHLHEADLHTAVLIKALLNDASMIQANLQDADISGGNLVGADLSCAALQGANLSDAKCRPARTSEEGQDDKTLLVSEATYDNSTIWPEDYDPAAHSATLAEA
jgi:uncharacterized protein YjbI with pentapeptide repeats